MLHGIIQRRLRSIRHEAVGARRRGQLLTSLTGMPFSTMNAVMPFAPLSGCVFAYTITVSATVPFVHLHPHKGLTVI